MRVNAGNTWKMQENPIHPNLQPSGCKLVYDSLYTP